MKHRIIRLAFIIALLLSTSVVYAQGDADVEDPSSMSLAADSSPDYTLSGFIMPASGELMSGGDYALTLQPLSAPDAQAITTEFWRLGFTDEQEAGLQAVSGRVFGPTASFRSNRNTTDLYYVFPAPGITRKVQAAYFYLLTRTGSYSGDALLSLEALNASGVAQRIVSASSVNLESAPMGAWTALTLSGLTDNRGIFPGEHLAFHVRLSGSPGGDLDVRPAFEVQIVDQTGPQPPPQADAALTKSVSPTSLWPGDTITYTLTYTNYGPSTATGIRITDVVPVTVTNSVVTYTGAAITPTGTASYTWEVADLARYEGGTITIVGQVNPAIQVSSWFTNTATIKGTTFDPVSSNNTGRAAARVVFAPVLQMSKLVEPQVDVAPHSEVTYTVVLSNIGPANATGTRFTDTLPALVDFARWIQYPSGTATAGDRITWNGTVTPGVALTWTFAVTHIGDYADVVTNTAEYGQATGNGSASATFHVTRPELSITKTVEPQVDVAYHGEVTYTMTLSNGGSIDAVGTQLIDTLPAQVDFARWVAYLAGTSQAGDEITWSGMVTAGATLSWIFVAAHTGDYGDMVNNTAYYSQTYSNGSAEAAFTVARPELVLDKTVEPQTKVAYHGEVTYMLTLNNNGAADALGVLLTDTIPAQAAFDRWLWQAGAMLNGSQVTWTGDVGAGAAITVSFVASHTGDYGDVVPNGAVFEHPATGQSGTDMATFRVVTTPSLSITKTVNPAANVPYHGAVTYVVTLNNTGGLDAANVWLTDSIPSLVTFDHWVQQSGAYIDGANVIWNGSVPGESAVEVSFVATHNGTYRDVVSNTVIFEYPATGQTGSAETEFAVGSPPPLTLSKEVNSQHILCGELVTYTVSLYNSGYETSVQTWLTDTLPPEVDFVDWVEAPPANTTMQNDELTWNGTITSAVTMRWIFQAQHVGACLDTVTNTAQYRNADSAQTAEAAFTADAPQLSVSKTVEAASPAPYHGEVTYTLTLNNAGTLNASGVLLTDTLPAQVEFARWETAPSGSAVNGNQITWSGTVRSDASLNWTFVVTHTGDYGDVVTNTVYSQLGSNIDTAETAFRVAGPPALQIDKSATPRYVPENGEITYTIVLTNASESDAVGVALTDTLPANATWARWVEQPAGTLASEDVILWTGDVTHSEVVVWSYVLEFTGEAGDVVINTAEFQFWGGSGSDEVTLESIQPIYLPIVTKGYFPAPDLVVEILSATSTTVRLRVTNQGDAPANTDFWVDVYFNPSTEPPPINHPWDTLAAHGLTWGVTDPIPAGGSVELVNNAGNPYYFSQYSSQPPLPVGQKVYAYVDSVNYDTTYGAVREINETNNTAGPVVSVAGAERAASADRGWNSSFGNLPPR